MKFKGELKFPEVDHPGVPVVFLIDGDQAELIVDEESLGRWSLYDVHARRLIASAFQIDLDGTEVTFVANDPIDFAYRGVEHMAETWAGIKSKRIATRSLAIRKSRKGTTPSRIEDLREAMQSNLETVEPRRIAGETSGLAGAQAADTVDETDSWDERDKAAAMPVIGGSTTDHQPEADPGEVAAEKEALERERRQLEEERARLEEQVRATEEREANLVEAYRLEMQRLEAEREELRRRAGVADTADEGPAAMPEEEIPVAVEPEPEVVPEPVVEEPVVEPEPQPVAEEPAVEPEPLPVAEEPAPEPEPQPADEEPVAGESGPEEEVAEPETAEPEPVSNAGVLNLTDFEDGDEGAAGAGPTVVPQPEPEPEPALAGAAKDKRNGGIMGAVRAAFRSGPRDHEHQFIEAPGGIGITRYVCEECGYVSIAVGD